MREVSVNGMEKLGMNIEREGWKKYICERIQESGRRTWKDGFNDTEREKEYVQMKESPRNESFADGSVGARVRIYRIPLFSLAEEWGRGRKLMACVTPL